MMVAEFGQIGWGNGSANASGAWELVGAAALLVPRLSVLLLLVDMGALVARVGVLNGDWIHTLVVGWLLGLVIYLQHEKLTGRPNHALTPVEFR